MESPLSQGGFFIPGTQRGTRFAKVASPGWKGLVTGGGDGRPGMRIVSRAEVLFYEIQRTIGQRSRNVAVSPTTEVPGAKQKPWNFILTYPQC